MDGMSVSEAARVLKVSRPTIYKYFKRFEVKPVIVAGHPVLTLAQVRLIQELLSPNGSRGRKLVVDSNTQ